MLRTRIDGWKENDLRAMQTEKRSGLTVIAAALLLLAAGGCSSLPDSLDPTQALDDDQLEENTRIVPPPDEGDGSYPNLSIVPARPAPITSFSERQAPEEALSGDYAQANYSTEPLRRSSQPPPPGTEGINLGPGPALMVQFEEGRAGLSAAARADLERMAIAQSALGGAIRIVGYAGGSEGRDALRAFSLSAERAEAVAATLKRLGVPAASLVTQAVGVDPRHFGGDTLGPRAEIFLDIGQASR